MKLCVKEISINDAREVKRAVLAAVDAGEREIDLSGVERAQSVALSVLLSARRRAAARGGDLTVVNAPEELRTLARLYGVEALLGFGPDKSEKA